MSTGALSSWDSAVFVLEEDARPSLEERARQLGDWCAGHPTACLTDVASSLDTEPNSRRLRLAIVAKSVADLQAKLRHSVRRLGEPDCRRINERAGIYYTEEPLGPHGRVAFLFPGEGAQYPGMLADLCFHFPEVRSCFDRLERALLRAGSSSSLSRHIFRRPADRAVRSDGQDPLWRMDGAVAAILTANLAMSGIMDRLKIAPDAVLGHSTGEYNALLASGAIRIEDSDELAQLLCQGTRLSVGLLSEGRIPEGVLLAICPIDPRDVTALAEAMVGRVWVAMDNCPHQVVLFARDDQAADEAIERLRGEGAVCQRLPFDRAYHTPLFAPVCAELERLFCDFRFATPATEVYSAATAGPYPADPEAIRELALRQWMSPVRFRETIEQMYRSGTTIFVEVGPRANLTTFVDDILRGRPHLAVPANVQHHSGITQLNHLVARLMANHVYVELRQLYESRAPRRLSFSAAAASQPPAPGQQIALCLPMITLARSAETPAPSCDRSPTRRTSHEANGAAVEAPPWPRAVAAITLNDQSAARAEAGRSAVMREYLRTMDRFLERQWAVLEAYMANALTDQAPAQADPLPPIRTAHAQDCRSLILDSPPIVSRAPMPRAQMDSRPGPCEPRARTGSLREVLLRIVEDRTGYPRDMLGLSADLEADLGIDSIKRAEILGAFQRETGILERQDLEEALRLRTLQEVLDFAEQRKTSSTDRAMPPSKADSVPIPASFVKETGPLITAGSSGSEGPVGTKLLSLNPGTEAHAIKVFDLDEDVLLRDHALGGCISTIDPDLHALVVVPLSASLECLAQVTQLLAPGKSLAGIRAVRAHRWLAFEEPRLEVEISVRSRPGTVNEFDASMSQRIDEALVGPAVEATFLFGEPAEPEPAGRFELPAERGPSRPADRLYSEVMFHGPAFRGVASIDGLGADAIRATLRVPDGPGLFHTPSDQASLTSPLLLDAAGQLVGFWTEEMLESKYVVFPNRVERIDYLGSPSRLGGPLEGRARVRLAPDARVLADIQVVDTRDTVRVRVRGWEDKQIDMSKQFFRFRMSPREVSLSSAWSPIPAKSLEPGDLACYRFDWKRSHIECEGGIWRLVLAHLVLSRDERRIWKSVMADDRRRRDWLAARVVAKDAVRAFVHQRSGIALYPADVEILTDEHGQPRVAVGDLPAITEQPVLSIAHADTLVVALVGDGSKYSAVGVAVEHLGGDHDDRASIAITWEEQALVESQLSAASHEWIARLRCAKAAVAKALGRSTVAASGSTIVRDVDILTGSIVLGRSDAPRGCAPGAEGYDMIADTAREDDLVSAVAFLERR
jgi:malonyl CoA-acyl carrier protein transacylase/phosphopantetheinyl transferase (holo-ACP synthase)